MDVYPKFIIEDGDLIIGKVAYHKHLATDPTKVIGGGWYIYRDKEKSFTFSDSSTDFGKAYMDDIKKCVDEGKVWLRDMTHNITTKFDFYYDTGTERIKLN